MDRVPCVELDKITEHTDEVLHVSFAHNGMMFCTCSKDGYVKVSTNNYYIIMDWIVFVINYLDNKQLSPVYLTPG